MSTAILMNQTDVLQNPKTGTWTYLPGEVIKNGGAVSACNPNVDILLSCGDGPQLTTQQATSNGSLVPSVPNLEPATQNTQDRDTPMRDASPELEIMEVRRVKRPIQSLPIATKASLVKPRPATLSDQNIRKVNSAPIPSQKRESFDMSMIDPALRDMGNACRSNKASISLASESRMRSLKRPAENMNDLANKRLKETPLQNQISSPINTTIHNSNNALQYFPPPTPTTTQITSPYPTPQWQPNTWTKQDYIRLATAVDSTFNYRAYGAHIHKHPGEVAEVFRGIVITPLLTTSSSLGNNPPTSSSSSSTDSVAESLMHTHHQTTTTTTNLLNPSSSPQSGATSSPSPSPHLDLDIYPALKARAILELTHDLRLQIEAQLKSQLISEGWVQLNKAKDLIAGYEREISTTTKIEPGAAGNLGADGRPLGGGGGGGGNVGTKPKIKPFHEAQKDLLAASIMFEKARRAEDRRVRNAERAEREARGEGGGGGNGGGLAGTGTGKKLGRPRKGEGGGKGKGGDFI